LAAGFFATFLAAGFFATFFAAGFFAAGFFAAGFLAAFFAAGFFLAVAMINSFRWLDRIACLDPTQLNRITKTSVQTND
jgi:hypothetical protein